MAATYAHTITSSRVDYDPDEDTGTVRYSRAEAQILRDALDAFLAAPEVEVGSIVRVKGDPQHGIADGTLAEVVDLEGAGFGQVTVRGYVTNRAQAWDHSDVGVQRQYVDRHLIEVVR